MKHSAENLASSFTTAISFPVVVLQLEEMLNDGCSSIGDISEVIGRDPGLAATLLKFANSPLYGFSGEVGTIDRAISLIGMREVRGLVFSVAVKSSFDNVESQLITMEEYWTHSLSCALVCREIADSIQYEQREALFTAGLLHDIGRLAMCSLIPDDYSNVLLRAKFAGDGKNDHEIEQELLGVDHAEVGYEIARAWNFPEVLQETIRFHNAPAKANLNQLQASVVHVANSVAALVGATDESDVRIPATAPEALQMVEACGVDVDQLWNMLPQVEATFRDMQPVFGIAA